MFCKVSLCVDNYPPLTLCHLDPKNLPRLPVVIPEHRQLDDLWQSFGPWDDVPGHGLPVVGGGGNQVHQPVSPPCLRGIFKFNHNIWGFQQIQPLITLATLPIQFQTVSLNTSRLHWSHVLTFLRACSKTVRKVFIESPPCKFQPLIPCTLVC